MNELYYNTNNTKHLFFVPMYLCFWPIYSDNLFNDGKNWFERVFHDSD